MSIALERLSLTELLAKPMAVVLSEMIGVPDCGYPRSVRVRRVGTPAWPLTKRAAVSASDAAETTVGIIVLMASIATLIGVKMGSPFEESQ